MRKSNEINIRPHHVRVGAIAIALATTLHVGGAGHIKESSRGLDDTSHARANINHIIERENETARHIVRFDEGLRLPTTSGGEA